MVPATTSKRQILEDMERRSVEFWSQAMEVLFDRAIQGQFHQRVYAQLLHEQILKAQKTA